MEKKEKNVDRIEIPEGIKVVVKGNKVIAEKDGKTLERRTSPFVEIKVEENNVLIRALKNNKSAKKMYGTLRAHIKNMFRGLDEGFEYKLGIASVHFPMNVSFDRDSNELVVKNFLGEKKDRKIKLSTGVEVDVQKDEIFVKSYDIEKAGQSSANIEKGTKVRNRDRRIFQDGIFIVQKPRRVLI